MSFEVERRFNRQFCEMYKKRLSVLSPLIRKKALSLNKTKCSFKDTLSNIGQDEFCFAIGIIYVETSAKRNILQETVKDSLLLIEEYKKEEATFYLEDESGRIKTIWETDQNNIVTGIVVGVFCSYNNQKTLSIFETVFPDALSYKKNLTMLNRKGTIVFVSGLNFGLDGSSMDKQVILFDWLEGSLNSEEITDVVFLDGFVIVNRKINQDFCMKSIDLLDKFLNSLCKKNINVHCIPGKNDPTSSLLPQQKISKKFFPLAKNNSNIFMYTNPSWFNIDEMSLLCVSSQPLNDLKFFFPFETEHSILEKTLNWKIIAPTAPDTLPCYSLGNLDPFIITETPFIYVSSTKKEFGISRYKNKDNETLILSLPEYSETGRVFLVKKKNLSVSEVTIKGISY